MRAVEIQIKINLARREVEYWQGVLANKTCGECNHFSRSGTCSKYNAAPPDGEKQPGCDDWDWNEIPF
jgi:hypothetical protein